MGEREFGMAIVAAPGRSAGDIARAIVERRLAACAQVTSEVTSLFWWKGKIEEEPERLILLKTERSRIHRIRELLEDIHPYDVPELLFFPSPTGGEDYLSWLSEVLNV